MQGLLAPVFASLLAPQLNGAITRFHRSIVNLKLACNYDQFYEILTPCYALEGVSIPNTSNFGLCGIYIKVAERVKHDTNSSF